MFCREQYWIRYNGYDEEMLTVDVNGKLEISTRQHIYSYSEFQSSEADSASADGSWFTVRYGVRV